MNASARIETKAEMGSEDHFSHDVSERLVTKDDEEMTAKTMPGPGQWPASGPSRERQPVTQHEAMKVISKTHPKHSPSIAC